MNVDVKTWLAEWFKENTDLEEGEIGVHDNYFEKGWIDSFQFISFITDIEEKFDVHFSNDEFQNRDFSTIDGLSEIILRRLNGK